MHPNPNTSRRYGAQGIDFDYKENRREELGTAALSSVSKCLTFLAIYMLDTCLFPSKGSWRHAFSGSEPICKMTDIRETAVFSYFGDRISSRG